MDADNVFPARLQPILDALASTVRSWTLTASGHRRALDRVNWPDITEDHAVVLLEAEGWQQADLVLARAYSPDDQPLVLVTGDGDFALLAARHAGPVLVVSGAASGRLHEVATVLDPALEGTDPLIRWFATV